MRPAPREEPVTPRPRLPHGNATPASLRGMRVRVKFEERWLLLLFWAMRSALEATAQSRSSRLSHFGPLPQQVVIDRGQRHQRRMLGVIPVSRMIDMSRSNSSARLVTSRIRLCVQKNEAMREPRVIGVTLCRLVPG